MVDVKGVAEIVASGVHFRVAVRAMRLDGKAALLHVAEKVVADTLAAKGVLAVLQ
jgi:hypothetical protein